MSKSQPAFTSIECQCPHVRLLPCPDPDKLVMQATFDNDPHAHKRLLKWLTKDGHMVSV